MGPYKILKDFDNQSFKIDLPSHLKQRGIHDVFHSSLLRIHIPNDDCLFPGCLYTQLINRPVNPEEYAIDQIKNHAGNDENTIFEIV